MISLSEGLEFNLCCCIIILYLLSDLWPFLQNSRQFLWIPVDSSRMTRFQKECVGQCEVLVSSRSQHVSHNGILVPTDLPWKWHRHLAHCSPLTTQEMASNTLVDGLNISDAALTGKCEDCIMGHQMWHPFDSSTEKDLKPLDLIAFDLWGPSCVCSTGGKLYLMMIVDAGSSYKYGAFLADKSDSAILGAFEIFRNQAETLTGRKICRLWSNGAFNSGTWTEFYQQLGSPMNPRLHIRWPRMVWLSARFKLQLMI